MSGGENIRRLLEATGIYRLTGRSPVDWEVDAYQAGLGQADAAMEALEAELFLSSAPGERLERWELLLRPQASEASLEERRRALVQAFSAWNRPANLEAMQDLLAAAGVRGSLREEDGKLLVALEEYQGVTAQEAQRMLDRLLPAHLEWEIQAR